MPQSNVAETSPFPALSSACAACRRAASAADAKELPKKKARAFCASPAPRPATSYACPAIESSRQTVRWASVPLSHMIEAPPGLSGPGAAGWKAIRRSRRNATPPGGRSPTTASNAARGTRPRPAPSTPCRRQTARMRSGGAGGRGWQTPSKARSGASEGDSRNLAHAEASLFRRLSGPVRTRPSADKAVWVSNLGPLWKPGGRFFFFFHPPPSLTS